MKKLGLNVAMLVALGAGLSACGTAQFARKTAPAGSALIYVYRPANMVGAFINGVATLSGGNGFSRTFPLRNDKHVATVVPAGDYTLSVSGAWGKMIANNMPIQAGDGSATFVRCVFHKECVMLPEGEGGPEVAHTRENIAGD